MSDLHRTSADQAEKGHQRHAGNRWLMIRAKAIQGYTNRFFMAGDNALALTSRNRLGMTMGYAAGDNPLDHGASAPLLQQYGALK